MKHLRMNIPETMAQFDGIYWLTQNPFTGEYEARLNDFVLRNVQEKMRDIAEQKYNSKWVDPKNVAAIERKDANKNLHTWEKLQDALQSGDMDFIIQQFVYSSSNRASTFRLFYHNPRSGQNKNNFAFYLTNKKDYFHPKGILKEKMTICSPIENSFDHFVMKGKALKDMEI